MKLLGESRMQNVKQQTWWPREFYIQHAFDDGNNPRTPTDTQVELCMATDREHG
jgi:hypothetical protein